jgi:hypothetical protein
MTRTVVRPEDCESAPVRPILARQRRWVFVSALVSASGISWWVIRAWFTWRSAWPAVISIGGAVLFVLAFLVQRNGGEWLALLGAMAAAAGTVLALQRVNGQWQTWMFAWPAVFPFSAGVAMIVFGLARWPGDTTAVAGVAYAVAGVVAYGFGAGIYEIVSNGPTGARLLKVSLPLIVAGLGGLCLVIAIWRMFWRRASDTAVSF